MSKHRSLLAAGIFVAILLRIASGAIIYRGHTMPDPDRANSTEHESPMDQNTSQQRDLVIAFAGAPIALESGTVTVVLKASRSEKSVKDLVSSAGPNRKFYLIIGELNAAQQPGVAYHVFFNLPSGIKPELNNPYYAGTVNFYNAVRLEGADPTAKDQRVFSFDITRLVRDLLSKAKLGAEVTVTLKPGGVPVEGAQARIGRLDLIAE